MGIKFTKMQGLGNDFMVINGIHQELNLSTQRICQWSDRHTGVGFDQLLLIEKSTQAGVDFNYRIFNADGQEVGQCGNGARCLALFAKHHGLTSKKEFVVATKTTTMQLQILENNLVRVNMGIPKLMPAEIPLLAKAKAPFYTLWVDQGTPVNVHALSVGNPHAVLEVKTIEEAPIDSLGATLSTHPSFPEETNVGFMQIMNSKHIRLRVYERGCGETLACGSGAVAAAAVGRLYYHLDASVKVSLDGGELQIDWPDLDGPISLTGSAHFIYEGKLF